METGKLLKLLAALALVAGNAAFAFGAPQPASASAAGMIECQGPAYNCGCFDGSCMGQWPSGADCERSVPDCAE